MFANLMVIIKSIDNECIKITVEYYSETNYSEALKLAMEQTSGDPIYLRIKQKNRKGL